jgi:hypothetical protein
VANWCTTRSSVPERRWRQALTERVCYGMELDPKYVEAVIPRWQSLSNKQAKLDGDGRTFDEIAQERRKEAA